MNRIEFGDFVKQQQEPLRRFLLNLSGGNATLSDDIAQDTFIKAYTSLSSFMGRSKMSTWLFKIAYNCFYDAVRKTALERQRSDIPVEELKVIRDESAQESRFNNQELYRALSQLKQEEKAIILLFYMEDKSIKEISTITGMNPSTVRSHISRGKSHLKQYLLTNEER